MRQIMNPAARRVLDVAREEAVSRGSRAVELEHVLLALLRDTVGLARPVLEECGVNCNDLYNKLSSNLQKPRPQAKPRGDMPYMPSAEKVINRARREAVAVGYVVVSSEHILFSLLGKSGPVTRYLEEVGMTYDKARVQLQALRWMRPVPIHFLRIKPKSDQTVTRQIVEQMREAVACGRLRVGDLLPPARQIAKQIGVGRATVDRAIGALMKMGILVAEGPRGVRVAEPQREETPDHERPLRLYKMMRRLAVDAFHMGAKPEEVEDALRNALRGIFFEGAGGESYGSGAHDDAAGAAD
jgi:DNA-binding transcriptional regulator YhcF (GntR family)